MNSYVIQSVGQSLRVNQKWSKHLQLAKPTRFWRGRIRDSKPAQGHSWLLSQGSLDGLHRRVVEEECLLGQLYLVKQSACAHGECRPPPPSPLLTASVLRAQGASWLLAGLARFTEASVGERQKYAQMAGTGFSKCCR